MQPREVSNLLARIAAVLKSFDQTSATATSWREQCAELALPTTDDWAWGCSTLLARLGRTPGQRVRSPRSLSEYQELISQARTLDRWHAPLVGGDDGFQPEGLIDHALLRIEIASDGGWIGQCDSGLIIPARASFRDRAELRSHHDELLTSWGAALAARNRGVVDPSFPPIARPDLLRSILNYTAFLPTRMNDCRGEPLTLDYVSIGTDQTAPATAKDEAESWRLGIAPMVFDAEDVNVEIGVDAESGQSHYGICPTYDESRIKAVVDEAVRRGVEVLLIPEMGLPGAGEAWLRSAIEDASGASPQGYSLRYVLAGLAKPPTQHGGKHQNVVVILNGFTGRKLYEQHKLYGWDLNPTQMTRLGLHRAFESTPPVLRENIDPGKTLAVLDFPDLGRLAALICADMDNEEPGDWCLRSLSLDWLYSPIMDIAIPRVAPDSVRANWIVKRAARAAVAGQARVMVTNSVSLSKRAQIENDQLDNGYDCFPCGVGFMLDATRRPLTFHHFAVPRIDACDVTEQLVVFDWNEAWPEYPDEIDRDA